MQASGLAPDMQEVQRHMMFVKALSGKRGPLAGGTDTTCHSVKQIVALWTGMIDKGMLLVGHNKKLHDIAMGDIKSHLVKDGTSLLQSVVALRKELVAFCNKLESIAQSLAKSEDTPDSLKTLLDETLPEAFKTELSCESFDDIISCYGAIKMNALEQEAMKFEKALQDYYTTKKVDVNIDHFNDLAAKWHQNLSEQFTFDELNQASKSILNYLPVVPLKDFSNVITSDPRLTTLS